MSLRFVVLALPLVWFLFAKQFLSALVSMVSGWGNGILTFKIFASSSAVKPAVFLWGGFLGVSPWMSLIFWTA